MPRTPPPPLGLTLTLLRSAQGWSQKELADAAGLSRGLISEYETGTTALTRERLVELAAHLGGSQEVVDVALLTLGTMRFAPPEPSSPVEPDEEQRRIIDRAAAMAAQGAALVIRDQLTREVREENARQGRQAAEILWSQLKPFSVRERRLLVTGAREYQDPFLCELLCAESERAAASSASRARELAELALLVAERVQGPSAWRSRLQGYAWAFIGNAHRVSNDLPAADAAFIRVWQFWREGAAAAPSLLDEARVLDLEASLRRDQRRFAEALDLHDRALAITNPRDAGYIHLNKAFTLEQGGDFERSIEALELAACSINEQREPRQVFALRFNQAVNLLHLGRIEDAELLISETRKLAVQLGNELDLVRVLWLQGRVFASLGRTAEAMSAFEQVRGEFASRELADDYALVSLELAMLWLAQKRTYEVKVVAQQMVWIFKTQGIHREAAAALRVFCEAAKGDSLTLELARSILDYLTKIRRDPGVRFEIFGPEP
jgi:transcriptional regulator with XRE-family HTH domain